MEDEKAQAAIQIRNIVNEIFQTEKSYAADLVTIVHTYQEKLAPRYAKIGLSEEEFNDLFANAPALEQFHKQFAQELESLMSGSNSDSVRLERLCDSFSKYIGIMTAFYSTYSSKSYERQVTLEKLAKNKGWREFYISLGNVPDINSFLIKPIQRLTRYPLLFETIAKNMTPGSPNYELVTSTIAKLKKMADDCNNESRVRQVEARLRRFQARVEGFEGSPIESLGDDIIFERNVIVSVGTSSLTRLKLHATLFPRKLVLAKLTKKDKLRFKFLINLDTSVAQEILVPGENEFYPFEISDSATKESYTFWEESEVSRESWMNSLQRSTHSMIAQADAAQSKVGPSPALGSLPARRGSMQSMIQASKSSDDISGSDSSPGAPRVGSFSSLHLGQVSFATTVSPEEKKKNRKSMGALTPRHSTAQIAIRSRINRAKIARDDSDIHSDQPIRTSTPVDPGSPGADSSESSPKPLRDSSPAIVQPLPVKPPLLRGRSRSLTDEANDVVSSNNAVKDTNIVINLPKRSSIDGSEVPSHPSPAPHTPLHSVPETISEADEQEKPLKQRDLLGDAPRVRHGSLRSVMAAKSSKKAIAGLAGMKESLTEMAKLQQNMLQQFTSAQTSIVLELHQARAALQAKNQDEALKIITSLIEKMESL